MKPCDDIHVPQQDPIPPNFSWQFIWSFFLRIPAARNWLFQSNPPPVSQTVNSLLSDPLLVGYVFGDIQRPQGPYPDIGDLQCLHHRSGDTLLAVHYGYQNIQPIVPMLHELSADPILTNPKVTVRRSAKQRISLLDAYYFLSIEFSWLESGVLYVATYVHPITTSLGSNISPSFISFVTDKTFAPATARRLTHIQQRFELYGETPGNPLPEDFLDPPDDCYISSAIEPNNLSHYSAIINSQDDPSSLKQFTVVQHFQSLTNVSAAAQLSKRPRSSSNISQLPRLEPGALKLWSEFTNMATASRRNTIYHANMYKRFGGSHARPIMLIKRTAKCTLLSATGLTARGRIQRLCSQLGIAASSPLLDGHVQHFFDDDDDNDHDPFSLFNYNAQSLQFFDLPTLPDQVVLDQDNSSNVIPFCDDTDYYVLDPLIQLPTNHPNTPPSSHITLHDIPIHVTENYGLATPTHPPHIQTFQTSHPIPLNPPTPPPSYIHEIHTVPPSNTQQRLNLQLPKRQRHSHTAARLPPTTPEHLEHQPITPPRAKPQHDQSPWPYNAPSKVLASPLYTIPSRLASSSHAASSSGNIASTNIPHQLPFIDLNASSTATTGLESEHHTAGPSSQTDGSAFTSSTATDRQNMAWVCSHCGMLIRGKKGNLNRHIANKHNQIRNFQCQEANCGRRFQTRLNLVRHQQAVHIGRPFACAECPRTFKSEMDLTSHVQSAHGARSKFECEVCGSCFGRRSTLNRHLTKVHKIELEKS